eukprot:GHVP01017489.1.p1 GENE.GHVP01017489.1~~GHVP01017489.1.p1  ORF type:complete len:120 (+),score=9.41 GHVP01017489.1:232-591(+)
MMIIYLFLSFLTSYIIEVTEYDIKTTTLTTNITATVTVVRTSEINPIPDQTMVMFITTTKDLRVNVLNTVNLMDTSTVWETETRIDAEYHSLDGLKINLGNPSNFIREDQWTGVLTVFS